MIAAAVVGGAAITGGRATLHGTLLGVVLLGAIGPALTFLGVSAYWERAIQGAIILAAVAFGMRLLLLATRRRSRRVFAGDLAELSHRSATPSRSTRVSIELGLLAVALTPVIVSGGIDLSVGSMIGLAAVVFGAATTAWHLPVPAAAAIALLVGAAGGALNGLAVARLGLPPLIVTLGSLSFFRGIAEGLTRGAVNYSGFPPRFLFLGQGFLGGVFPRSCRCSCWCSRATSSCCIARSSGRALYAIGFSSAGAACRSAGRAPCRLVYMLSGLTASLAAIIYVAHLGQAKADAGTGYELDAITAVVLGGTSIFGGRGTLWGTLLGLSALSPLQNGLRLAALPSELTGLLTGALLVTTIALDRMRARGSASPATSTEEVDVKNSQVAVICATILAGALLVSGTNVWLLRSLGQRRRLRPPAG